MIDLPNNCEVNKIIPKKTFYDKLEISNKTKEKFINILEKIIWKYKLSEDTINITKTENVEEIEIFELILKKDENIKDILNVITKGIPYKILFIIKHNDKVKYAIRYKEDFFITEWNENIKLNLNDISLEEVYENLVKEITKIHNNDNKLEEEIDKKKKIEEIHKEIEKLKSKLKNEKQFNIKVEINKEIINKNKELGELLNE